MTVGCSCGSKMETLDLRGLVPPPPWRRSCSTSNNSSSSSSGSGNGSSKQHVIHSLSDIFPSVGEDLIFSQDHGLVYCPSQCQDGLRIILSDSWTALSGSSGSGSSSTDQPMVM